MDSFELNKIAGAILFGLLVTFGLSIVSETIFETETPEAPGYLIAVAEAPAAGGAAGGETARQPIAVLLASADPAAGEASAKKCATCHSFAEGEAPKVGPNLYGIVTRPIAAAEYEYSEAMRAYAGQAQTWTYENLDAFLHDPKGVVPGTKMAFAGLKNDPERANVIAYLRTLAATPAPLPEAPPAEAAAPAEGAPPAAGAAPAEAAGESGTGGQSTGQPQGSLGAIDAVPADQQGGVPQVAPVQQPSPEPPAGAPAAGATPPAAPPGAPAPAPADPAPAPAEGAAPAPQQQSGAPADPAAAPAEGAPTQPQVAQVDPQQPAAPAPDAPAPAAPAASPAAPAAAPAAPATAPAGGFAALVDAADPAKGEAAARKCVACHSFEPGAPHKVGPNLAGVVDRPIASAPDYQYSEAMIAFSEAGAKRWTVDELNAFLQNPKAHVPGTKMAFPGLRNEADRANVVGYLRGLAAEPAPAPQ